MKTDTSGFQIRNLLDQAGLEGVAFDRVGPRIYDVDNFRYHLEELNPSITPKTHFAILIQEPTPNAVDMFLQAVHTTYEIVGTVAPFLLELSIDFRPKNGLTPEEALKCREQMVGIIHRHVWCDPDNLNDSKTDISPINDPRQVYDGEKDGKTQTCFLISSDNSDDRKSIYAWKKHADVRKGLLAPSKAEIYLNSTLYYGSRQRGFQVSLQHKVADKRNRIKSSSTALSDTERRARIEIELHGAPRLRELKIHTLKDLSSANFRKAFSEFCSFKFPTMRKTGANPDAFMNIFEMRGVVGISLADEVQDFEEWKEKINAGEKLGRKKRRQKTPGLVPWVEMNELTGTALEKLMIKWKKFS